MKYSQSQNIMCRWLLIIISIFSMRVVAQEDVGDALVLTRPVTITIDVQSHAGDMLVNVPLQILTKYGIVFGATDVNGQAVLHVNASPDQDLTAVIKIHDGSWHPELSDDDRFYYQGRFNELMDSYAFSSRYIVNLDPAVDQYSFTLHAFERVKITGRFINANSGEPLWLVNGGLIPYAPVFTTRDDGLFEISTQKDHWAELFFGIPDTHQLKFIEIAPGQVQGDLDLGDIPLIGAVEDSQLAIDFLYPDVVIIDKLYLSTSKAFVTLINGDASVVLAYFTNESHTAAVNEPWDTTGLPPQVPAGTYYLAVGFYGENSVRVLRLALLNGRKLLLDAAGVAKVTVPENGQASITIDAQANIDAIMLVGGDLIE